MTRSFQHLCLAALTAVFCVAAPLASAAERVVSIGGDVTEIIYALGLGGQIVAVDSTSGYPVDTQKLPNVGYMRQLSAEPILALAPDYILAVADAGPESAVNVLKAAGVRYKTIPDEPSVEGTLAKIRAVGAALGAKEAAEELARTVAAKVATARRMVGEPSHRPRTLFLLSVGRGGLMAGGHSTSADTIIRLAGGQNLAGGIEGYKPFEPEAMNALDPEVILMTERTLAALGGKDAMLGQPQFAGTSAARAGRLIAMDGMLLLGFGPRLPQAIETLAAAFHKGKRVEEAR